jgi:autotransporter-associated beta strand protein
MKPETTRKRKPSVQTPRSAVTTTKLIKMFMKTRLALFTLALCGAFAGTPAFGQQAVIVWGGQSSGGDGVNLSETTNWVGNVRPNTGNADIGLFDSTVPGDLHLVYNDGAYASGPGLNGINWTVDASHVGTVSISNTLAAPNYLAVQNVTNNGQGAFFFGDSNPANIFWVIKRPNGGVQSWVNNSAIPGTINPWTRWAGGGGANWTYSFQGTGDWQVNNYLQPDNGPSATVQVDGPGTMYWNPSGFFGANGIVSPVIINAGALVLQAPHSKLNNVAWTIVGLFKFDAPSQAQTLTGVISGAGQVWVANGTLTLSGANTYTGPTVLTNSGTLVLNRAENTTPGTSGPLGESGSVFFHGGTLQWSAVNTFDYSSRFDLTDGEQFSFNTGGQTVTLASYLFGTGSTLAKSGAGNLFLTGGADYTGLTTITGGKLVFQSAKGGSGGITVADGAALGVFAENQTTADTLSLGTSTGCTVEFNDLASTTTAPLVANTITNNGTVTININSGTFNTIGAHYPLISWTTGNPPAVQLGTLSGANGILVTNGNTIQLNITATAFVWTGLGGSVWDTSTPGNWKQSGSDAVFQNGAPALIDDTGSQTTINLNGVVQPTSTTVNNTLIPSYTMVSSSGKDLAGSGGLTKNGNGLLMMQGGANTYTGVTTISAGTLSVSNLFNGGAASDIGAANNSPTNLVLNGGVLQYTGSGASIDRLFTVTSGGGTIDASGTGALSLTNTGSINAPGSGIHNLILTGSDTNGETLAALIADGAGGAISLTKNGPNTWILTGTNTYSGGTSISGGGGALQIGAGGGSGTIGSGNVNNSGRLVINRTGFLTVSGNITGSGSVVLGGGGTNSFSGNDSYSGGTTISNGTTLQLTGSGTLNPNVNVNNNGTFIMNSSTPLNISGFNTGISGAGNVIVSNNRFLALIDYAAFTGWVQIGTGATFQPCYGNEGRLFASVVTNNGTLLFIRQDPGAFIYTNNIVGSGKVVKDNNNANSGDVTLCGTNNTYTGGTWIGGGGIVLSGLYNTIIDTNLNTTNITYVAGGNIVGNVIFTNTATGFLNSRYLTFSRDDNYTFSGNIIGAVTDASAVFNQGSVIQEGAGTLTLTGNNTYVAGTTISNGVVMMGAGGTSGTLGSGTVTIQPATSWLVFNRADSVTFSNQISGLGGIMQIGPGTLTLPRTNYAYAGPTVVSNGILVISGEIEPGNVIVSNELDVVGGKLVAGAYGSVDTLTVGLGGLNISNGVVYVAVNKASTPTSTYYNIPAGSIQASNATLEVINYGSALVAGDMFTVFNQPVQMALGEQLKFISPGVTFTDNQDGTISVASVATGTPAVTATVSGGQLNMSWPSVWTGLHVQVQTNTLAKGLGTNWFTIPGTDLNNSYSATLGKQTNSSVFYRLAP